MICTVYIVLGPRTPEAPSWLAYKASGSYCPDSDERLILKVLEVL